MNHSQIRAFHAVARMGSFTRASKSLGVSQSTLSSQVKMLEEGYGIVLFRRGSREVTMTDTGRTLYEMTTRYFVVESEVQNALKSARQVVTGTLRVGADAPYSVIPVLAAFGRRYPEVERLVFFGNSKDVLNKVLSVASDIGILPGIGKHKRLDVIPLRTDRLVIFVPRNHPWALRRRVSLQDLTNETVILREDGSTTRSVFDAVLKDNNVKLDKTIVMGSREAVREAVAFGMGVGVVSEGEFGHDSRLHKLPIRNVQLGATECLICRKADRELPLVKAFVEMARSGIDTDLVSVA